MMPIELIIRHPHADSKPNGYTKEYAQRYTGRDCPHTSLSLKTGREKKKKTEQQRCKKENCAGSAGPLAVFPATQKDHRLRSSLGYRARATPV